VHEGLTDVAVDDQLAGLHDLAELVLGVAVDVHLQPVDAGGLVVAGAVVEVDAHTRGVRPEADARLDESGSPGHTRLRGSGT